MSPNALLLAALCLLSGSLPAHGGMYRGPTYPGLKGPDGKPLKPGMIPGGPLTGGNANLDVGSWRVWWELNHDQYVKGRGSEVTDEVRRDTVLPVLKRALDATNDPDINSACLIALGKSVVDHPDFDALEVIRARLKRSHIEIREAAVLALGISGRSEAFEDLDELLRNTAAGRKLIGRSKVGDRVRTFAAYALGLLANRSGAAAIKTKVLGSLTTVLEDKNLKDRDLLTGVLNGMRLIGADPNQGAAHKRVLWTAITAIEKHQKRRFKDHRVAVQSHGLTALAALVGRGDGVDQQRAKKLVLDVLQRRRRESEVCVSATIALGELLLPTDKKELEVLERLVSRPPDLLVSKFAMIAFGKIGGQTAYKQLSRAFGRGKRDIPSWAAIGLGLLAHSAKAPEGQKKDLRAEVRKLLRKGLKSNRKKNLQAAIAIGLGLAGGTDAAPDLRKLAEKYSSLGDFAGPLCVSLAMLDDRPSVQIAKDAMSTVERPLLFAHAALALAKFDERNVSGRAVSVLQVRRRDMRPGFLPHLAAAAQAIGHLKNKSDVASLALIVGRAKGKDYAAAFAAAALGSVVDRDPLGFGARVSRGMNYTVRAQTISNGRNGILDIF